ncbi:MAG: 30S ribosome-binding factor RbfA [Gammaproteobacteria bacterium]|nr:30S ribosome-binding factor RbfA [Gammaproteobacteria bacterium]
MSAKQKLYHRPKNFGRELRVADFIRVELTDLLRHKMRDPRVTAADVTISDVRVSRDLAYADVYVACSGASEASSEDELISVMRNAAGFFRSELAQRHSMRTTPELRFHFDRTEAEANRIEELLARVRSS